MLEKYIDESAQFPPSMWAAFDSTTERTTNACESFHSDYNEEFTSTDPNIYAFVSVFKEIQEEVTINVNDLEKDLSHKDPSSALLQKVSERELYMQMYLDEDIDLYTYVEKMSKTFSPKT